MSQIKKVAPNIKITFYTSCRYLKLRNISFNYKETKEASYLHTKHDFKIFRIQRFI